MMWTLDQLDTLVRARDLARREAEVELSCGWGGDAVRFARAAELLFAANLVDEMLYQSPKPMGVS
ncbi:hypothetical protein [Bifidobacterium aesculapii]|uniref:hypothetical protein n=1 Tax=Bifidobacterium aesculapii TaxID=1329411 RepID=UPI0006E1EBFF|nr:hypothetical protein [Bifidobacterium aesculapii]